MCFLMYIDKGVFCISQNLLTYTHTIAGYLVVSARNSFIDILSVRRAHWAVCRDRAEGGWLPPRPHTPRIGVKTSGSTQQFEVRRGGSAAWLLRR